MHATDEVQVGFGHQQVQVEGGRLTMQVQVELDLPMPASDERLPQQIEQSVDQAGQRFKREMFRLAMEKADAELVVAGRDGESGQGTRRRGTSPMTFKTRFGTVEVQRQRVEEKATGKVTTPAAKAWNTPQQVTITRGLRQQVCQTVRNQSMQDSLEQVEEQAGEPGLLGKTTVEEIVHVEGKALEEALRQRAQAVMDAHPQAAAFFVPAAERAGQAIDDEESLFEDFPEPEPPTGFGETDEAEEFERLEGPRAVDEGCVIVQADEVKVKAQACTGRKEVWVYTAVIMTATATWRFAAQSTDSLWLQVGAWLTTLGVHEGKLRLLTLADGAKWIRVWYESLDLPGTAMILCWYHLKKRCGQLLSMACRGREHRRKLERELLGLLWEGRVGASIAMLQSRREQMKAPNRLDELIKYLGARQPYIPNYCERQSAGLWVASNRVEKLNDWAVSQRCKHSGMAWTSAGVSALAWLEVTDRNGELPVWWERQELLPWPTQTFQIAV